MTILNKVLKNMGAFFCVIYSTILWLTYSQKSCLCKNPGKQFYGSFLRTVLQILVHFIRMTFKSLITKKHFGTTLRLLKYFLKVWSQKISEICHGFLRISMKPNRSRVLKIFPRNFRKNFFKLSYFRSILPIVTLLSQLPSHPPSRTRTLSAAPRPLKKIRFQQDLKPKL